MVVHYPLVSFLTWPAGARDNGQSVASRAGNGGAEGQTATPERLWAFRCLGRRKRRAYVGVTAVKPLVLELTLRIISFSDAAPGTNGDPISMVTTLIPAPTPTTPVAVRPEPYIPNIQSSPPAPIERVQGFRGARLSVPMGLEP
jgi:hypothetical protein